jgi:integrase
MSREFIERSRRGGSQAGKVSYVDIARLHLKWKRTPYQANRILTVLASLFSFASRRKLLPPQFNPARGIEKLPEQGRERFLSFEELERLGAACSFRCGPAAASI